MARRTSRPIGAGTLDIHDGHYVYQAFDEFDRLLYVGVTNNVARRFGDHRAVAPWYRFVDRVEWTAWRSRLAAETEEARLIHDLKPLYNIQGAATVVAFPMPPAPTMSLPPAERHRQAAAAHRRLALGDAI